MDATSEEEEELEAGAAELLVELLLAAGVMGAGVALAGAGDGAGVLGALTATIVGAKPSEDGAGVGDAAAGVDAGVTGAGFGAATAGVAAMAGEAAGWAALTLGVLVTVGVEATAG